MLKRLEIQCVFKELVKDIVVKGHSPRHLPLYGIMSGAYYFVGGWYSSLPGCIASAAERLSPRTCAGPYGAMQ